MNKSTDIKVTISQGHNIQVPPDCVCIVIDVLRAFTVTHYAFAGDIKKIMLVYDVESAFALRAKNESAILIGEVEGLPIDGFDAGNSPTEIKKIKLKDKTLIMRTTNGVTAVLNAGEPRELLACGFVNAKVTAQYVRDFCDKQKIRKVAIIASHPKSDDDLACAEYLQNKILGLPSETPTQVATRIRKSICAKKFLDPAQPNFDIEDLELACHEETVNFVVKLTNKSPPMLEKVVFK
jgi:2-phosphosulfolactate phosphatase